MVGIDGDTNILLKMLNQIWMNCLVERELFKSSETALPNQALMNPKQGQGRPGVSRDLQERFREKRVLLVGSKDTAEVAESYGFDVGNMAAARPDMVVVGFFVASN